MQVRVLYFGMVKDLAGSANETVCLPEGATVEDVIAHCRGRMPKLERLLPSLAVSVNHEFSPRDAKLRDQDEIGLLPPVSGGSGPQHRVELVREPIEPQHVVADLKFSGTGAVVVFEGVVRDNSRGRRTTYLEYEAYDPMAIKQMRRIVDEACSRFEIQDATIIHRLGRLEVGETSVLIVVASAHRAAGFEACRWLIDTLKKTIPIWKKEYFADGAVWADGEPFPSDITGSTASAERIGQ